MERRSKESLGVHTPAKPQPRRVDERLRRWHHVGRRVKAGAQVLIQPGTLKRVL